MSVTSERASSPVAAVPPFQRSLHIFALCAFAITQPILVALIKQTVYLHDQQMGWLQIGVLLAILTLIVPSAAVLLDRIVLRVTKSLQGRGQNSVLAILMATIILSLLRPYTAITALDTTGFIGLIAVAIAVTCTWWLIRFYKRLPGFRSWVTISSIGLVIFPGAFLWQFQILRQQEVTIENGTDVGNPAPVILVVFDEFCGTTLMNERGEIDAERFPNFARLAQQSTWYRNATTVHARTQVAVPAILSGRYPVNEKSPLAAQYPGNLLQLIESTRKYEMAVFEAATRLCPMSVRIEPSIKPSAWQRSIELVHTMAAVYPRLVVSRDVPIWFPTIPRAWFGLSNNPHWNESDALKPTEGRFNYSSSLGREQQFDHFLTCVHASERPRFCFYHTVLPHYPWCFLPSGEQYLIEASAPRFPSGAAGELGEDWRSDPEIVLRNEHRYRLQAGFVDLLIGRLLDRLQLTGLMDRCLLIVTADHGVSFQPGHSRRLPDGTNLTDIMSVPLFIKEPGQTQPGSDDRNIETIDLLPTIAEQLKIDLPEPVDGISISVGKRRPRKTLYFESGMTVCEPDLPQRKAALKRQALLFKAGPLDQLPVGAVTHPDWPGQPVSSFKIDRQTLPVYMGTPLQPPEWLRNAPHGILTNHLITGWLDSKDVRGTARELVVVVDGTVVDTGRTFPFSRGYQGFEFLLPKSIKFKTDDQIELYLVEQAEPRVRLRRLKKEPAPLEFSTTE